MTTCGSWNGTSQEATATHLAAHAAERLRRHSYQTMRLLHPEMSDSQIHDYLMGRIEIDEVTASLTAGSDRTTPDDPSPERKAIPI